MVVMPGEFTAILPSEAEVRLLSPLSHFRPQYYGFGFLNNSMAFVYDAPMRAKSV
jgi:hypothetical protein